MLVLSARKARLTCLAFSPDGRSLAASGYGGTIQLWDLDSHQMNATITTGWWRHDKLFFAADGRLFVFSCRALFQVDPHEPASPPIRWHYNYPGLLAAALSLDGRFVCVVNAPAYPKAASLDLIDLADRSTVWTIFDVGAPVSALALSNRCRLAATGSPFGPVAIYDPRCEGVWRSPASGNLAVKSIALTPDGQVVAWCADAHLHLWRLDPLEELAHHRLGRTHFNSVTVHPSGEFFATANGDGKIDYWDAVSGERRESFDWGIGKLQTVVFDTTGDRAACAGPSGQIVVWDVDR